tara:strand:+ start:513 stop:2816 length:2304 start_codon:yes stop_codon:yes gene_type:complete
MKSTVPLQTELGQQYESGSEVQLSGGRVVPSKDVVSDGIKAQGKALMSVGQIINKLDDERNDAEARELYNEYYGQVEARTNQFLTLKGSQAVATVNKEENLKEYDVAGQDIKRLTDEYGTKASNGVVKYMFEKMASVSARAAENKMLKHSIVQQRKYLEQETATKLKTHQRDVVLGDNYKTWADPEGEFNKNMAKGIATLQELAVLKGWNIDPRQGQVSSQYLESLNNFTMEIYKTVIDRYAEDKNTGGVKDFIKYLNNSIQDEKVVNKLTENVKEKHTEFLIDNTVNGVLDNNRDQNDGTYLSQTSKLATLDSNNKFDNGLGAAVVHGFNSDDEFIDITNRTVPEKIEMLEQVRNTSKFYNPETTTRIIKEHATTHLFAIQKLGVKKADSLYTKAKSGLVNNEKILDKYNKLITEEVNKKYGKGDYAAAVVNDLEVIKQGIDYNFVDNNFKIDPVTNTRPLKDLKQELRNTIKDPKELVYAIKDLEIKYNKNKNSKEEIYNQELNAAKQIAFAEPGGWKNLTANNINIDDFKKEDQAILKQGHPVKSDVDTVIDLERNPLEVATNLDSYSHKLSQPQYLELARYAKELQGEGKVLEANVDSDMFDSSLIKYGYTDIVNKVTDDPKAKDQYNFRFDYKQIKDAWKDRIDQVQTNTGKKLNRTEKQKLLDEILADGVITKRWGLFRKSDITIPTVALEADQFKDAFVFVGSEKVFTYNIPKDVREYFIAGYDAAGMSYTEEMIANEWILHGKKKKKSEIIKYKEENNL